MRKPLFLAFVTAGLVLLGPAQAADKPSFKKADQDGSGKVSIQEAKKAGAPEKEAKQEDLDNDGKLTKDDWKFVDFGSGSSGSSES